MVLIEIDKIANIIESVLKTGRIKNENAMGCMVIAPPEHGKSEILELFSKNPNVSWCNDLSSNPLIQKILPEVEANRITHIIIPDFLKILAHGKKTTMSLLTLLNSLTAEGIKSINFFGVERTFSRPLKAGIILSITREAFERRKCYWREIGFLSRCPPITYIYSDDTKKRINGWISLGQYSKVDYISLPKTKRDIIINPEISRVINNLQDAWHNKVESYTGFRLHKQLRVLSKAIAYEDGEVQRKHIEVLMNYLKFMNFDYTVI